MAESAGRKGRGKLPNRDSALRITIIFTPIAILIFLDLFIVGWGTPAKAFGSAVLIITFLAIGIVSALVMEVSRARRRARLREFLPVFLEDQKARPPIGEFRASGRRWRSAATMLAMIPFFIAIELGSLLVNTSEVRLLDAFRLFGLVLIALCLASSTSLLMKNTIAVNHLGIRYDGRLPRNFSTPWGQVAKIICADITSILLGGGKMRPIRTYMFRNANGELLGFFTPQTELGPFDAQTMERVLIEQAAEHGIEIVPR